VVSVSPRADVSARAHSLSQRFFVVTLSILLFVFYALPLSALPLRSVLRLEADEGQRGQVQSGLTADYYRELFVNRNDSIFYVPPFAAIGNSLGYAGVTVILSPAAGLPGRHCAGPSRPAGAPARPIDYAAVGSLGGDARPGAHNYI